ncbi:DUF1206 domain-containing protein [Cellulomonas sp. ATA003]|uniref:DUF1206 domain-containing protein n=1 Tax=Cellulomonas sp. ATA003 TaxID=3073064 RepID=UPI002873CED5|nr:DUF1206 domain-containing protein [Cellulomonas sp. ATA003]WNB84379.1 DUF1206 domain-containing protein [Cellulomonas sp. ATA003]
MDGRTRSTARQAESHPVVEKGARLGYAANGLINVVIGWIALQLAIGGGGGGGGEEASTSGALRTLAEQPFGQVLLWVILVGFVLLGLWQAATAFLGGETKDRVKAAAKAVTYLVLAGLTGSIVLGSGGGSGGSAGLTATLMQQPFGRVLVALVGAGVIAVGLYQAHKGWTRKFVGDLQERPASWVVTAGRIGYVARGLAFVVVGGLFVTAAWRSDPQEAQGLDGALQTMLQVPFGRVLLGVVAVGFVAYGVYSFARAKYADI